MTKQTLTTKFDVLAKDLKKLVDNQTYLLAAMLANALGLFAVALSLVFG